jgi:hypothetical protein
MICKVILNQNKIWIIFIWLYKKLKEYLFQGNNIKIDDKK